jgi:hypothetical protein
MVSKVSVSRSDQTSRFSPGILLGFVPIFKVKQLKKQLYEK